MSKIMSKKAISKSVLSTVGRTSSKALNISSSKTGSDDNIDSLTFSSEVSRDRSHHRGDFAVFLYMREIGEVALLTPDEEAALAKRIQDGDDAARERMIRANLRLVVKIAREYEHMGLPLLDLVNEGNIGLMRGVERFRADKDCRFSTYGAWWIRQGIERAIHKQRSTIRVPVHVLEHLEKMTKVARKLERALGREPTDEEVAVDCGMKPGYVGKLKWVKQSICSLDAAIDVDGDLSVKETLPDPSSPDPFKELSTSEEEKILINSLLALEDREAEVLRMRYGIGRESVMTLKQIGDEMGITRERVRQIEKRALNKLGDEVKSQDIEY